MNNMSIYTDYAWLVYTLILSLHKQFYARFNIYEEHI